MPEQLIRALTPKEFDLIYEVIPKDKHKRGFDTALNTGMRFKELETFVKHPKWFNSERFIIFLPRFETKIKKERNVHLTKNFNKILKLYLKDGLEYPSRRSWLYNVQRWAKMAGIEDWGNINTKTTRKTWESWLVMSDYNPLKILASQGHIDSTSLAHYLNLSFTSEEIKEIRMRTAGWME